MTESAVPVFITAGHFMFLVYVAERKKNVSSRGVHRNEDAEIVGSNPAVINHSFFCEVRKTSPNYDVVKRSQPELQLIVRG